nr:HD domain-containing protein [uncultured Allomuricauda sp.]
MDLNGKTLEQWFLALEMKDNIFPYDLPYTKDYDGIAAKLNKWVHPYVNTGAMIEDGGCLTDHGPDHIKKVILRASQLLQDSECKLYAYEVFVLLMAIHIHDIGNILGRKNHEINSLEVMKKAQLAEGRDRIEWDTILEIAEAHGGDPKDKISNLETEKILDQIVRKPLLASILKFADELADDRTRANRFALLGKELPDESIIYHKYAYSLHSVDINHKAGQISLSFDIEEDDVNKTFLKKIKDKATGKWIDTQQYLIDEIYERTLKTHLERTYCMRFMRTDIELTIVRVAIRITLNEKDPRDKKRKKRNITYDLGERGYPTIHPHEITTLCPQLMEYSGEKVFEKIMRKNLENVTC